MNKPTSSTLVRSLLTLAVAASGCVFTADDAGDPSGHDSRFAACRGDLDDEEVDEAVRIVDSYAYSVHEMIACGMLNVQLCMGVTSGVIEAMIAGRADATPDGWSFEDGVYRTAGNGATMETRFYLAVDTGFGKAGDRIEPNLFLVDSYLVDAVLAIDLSDGSTEIRYREHGPLVELMGFGPNPPNPLPVDAGDLDDLRARLGAIDFDARISVDDLQPAATVAYHVDVPRMGASALLGGEDMRYELVSADAQRGDLGQTLVVDDWDLAFLQQGVLDGDVAFHVDGGPLAYAGELSWQQSAYRDAPQLRCPQ
jgi:hypothetical protein